MKNNSTCSICGKGYYACLSCKDELKLYPWKFYTDTVEHYKYHLIISNYLNKIITKEEAKAKLLSLDLSEKESFKDNIKNVINEIIGEPKNYNKNNKELDNNKKLDDNPINNKGNIESESQLNVKAIESNSSLNNKNGDEIKIEKRRKKDSKYSKNITLEK